jgi:hypothetical protein
MERIRVEGDDACAHPAFEPEIYLGTPTSEYVCTLCGKSFSYEYMKYVLEIARRSRSRLRAAQ